MSVGSLAYRRNENAIKDGNAPEKYTRLVGHIPGHKILEAGAAEGVLALLLAKTGKLVTTVEKNAGRHRAALELCRNWFARDKDFVKPKYINGAIGDHLDLLEGMDTFVAVRVIYYLGDDIDRIFARISDNVKNVVLCGNRNRAERYRSGVPDDADGPHNFYASIEGMTALLKRHGYRIVSTVTEGDEIVVGYMD